MCKAARTPVISHDRPSPRLVFCGWTPFPTLSISDAERRAYHNRRVSDARYPQRIFDTLWMLVRSDSHRCQTRFSLVCKVSNLAQKIGANEHPYPVVPRRDPTTEWCFVRGKYAEGEVDVGSRLAATYQAIVFRFAKSPT